MKIKFFPMLIFTLTFSTMVISAPKPPYLGVSNSSKEWNVIVSYKTQSEPKGSMEVKTNTATGMPGFDNGEKVQLVDFLFTNDSGASLPFEDWCPNISRAKIYNWIAIQITQKGSRVDVTCNASSE